MMAVFTGADFARFRAMAVAAEEHPCTEEDIKAQHRGENPAPGTKLRHAHVAGDHFFVFTIDERPGVWVRHLSVGNLRAAWPSYAGVALVLSSFGFVGSIAKKGTLQVYREPNPLRPGAFIIHIVEPYE